jgi:NADH dehydrogenase
MKIWLIEAGPKLLGNMSRNASEKAYFYLSRLGIAIELNAGVKNYDGKLVLYGDDKSISSRIVIWTAGVMGIPVPGLESSLVAGARIKVNSYNQVEGYDSVFALGDVAAMIDEKNPKGHPMVATVAIQQARLFAANVFRIIKGKQMVPFHYCDKGTMATVGRNKAVVDLRRIKFQGVLAWYFWMFIHLMALAGFRNRMITFTNWVWNYFTYERAFRLIIRPYKRP